MNDLEAKARHIPEDYVDYLRMQQGIVSIQFDSINIEIFPGVFHPATDAFLMNRNLHSYINAASRTLDMTSGSGVLALAAASLGASGIAIDINPNAVANMEHNFKKIVNAHFTAIESDAFENVPDDLFNLIIATPPYLDGPRQDSLDYAVHGTTHFVDELLKGARSYLSKDGKILITYAQWGLIDMFKQKMNEYGMKYKIIDSATSSDGERHYDLYEVQPEQ